MSIQWPSIHRGRGHNCVWWWEVFPLIGYRSRLALTDGDTVDEFYEYEFIKEGVDELIKYMNPDHRIPGGWRRAMFRGETYRNSETIMDARGDIEILFESDDYEVTCDGNALWVNNHVMLGRFCPRGRDVHVDGSCGPETCSHIAYWPYFVSDMKKIHDIDVGSYRKELVWLA